MPAPILIGFDPLRGDRGPLELGLAAHELTGAPLVVAMVGDGEDPALPVPFEPLRLTGASPPRALHRAAEERGAGLIVVGSTARSAVGRVLPGSTAQRLLSGAGCAVALAPSGWERRPFATVAVGFVDTPEGHAALRAAHLLALLCGAKLRVISVLQPSTGIRDAAAQGAPAEREFDLEGRDRAAYEAALRQATAALGTDVAVEPEVHVDDPADTLVRISANVDALVCGSRGYGPVRSVLLGGVSGRVVDGAQCPVIVLPRAVEHPIADLTTSPAGPSSGTM